MFFVLDKIKINRPVCKNSNILAVGPMRKSIAEKLDRSKETQQVRQIITETKGSFVAQDILKFVDCPMPQMSCANSKQFFIDAADEGALVAANTKYYERNADGTYTLHNWRFYVKGVVGFHGNALAYEPVQNTIYSLIIRDGELTIIDPLKKLNGTQLADKIMQLQE